MGVDAYLLVPTPSPGRARRAFDESELVEVGCDYVVLYEGERFATLQAHPQAWGAEYYSMLPRWLRRGLDPRGILAVPDAGGVPQHTHYADAVRATRTPLFLPVRRSRVKKTRHRSLLVELSANRERLLRADPELVRRLVAAIAERRRVVPSSIELEGAALGRAPLGGVPLYEDEHIESARLLPIERVREIVASKSSRTNARNFYEGAAAHGHAVLAVRFRW